MSDEVLHRHGQALEEAFFVEKNRELLAKLRDQAARDDLRASLREAAGSVDDATLDYLVTHGIRPETLAALKLVPLVTVCWANGVVESEERELVLQSAEKQGLQPGVPGYELLQSWLETRPDPALFAAWKNYVHALASQADPATISSLKQEILGTSREVADAAGKLFGYFLGTSAEEKAVLREIEHAFERTA
ncbi:MAG TPA: hypothetical protein VGN57_13775 [Pirellulaceae bacterium]|jgi:hypothetical protein|nr:hypothetical protein [Pirellulaceae bacterium]